MITEKDKIYLSKNNNNILRIKDLSNIENSIFLIMFRSPLEHSNSLLKQHNNFVNLQQRETFIKDYMSSIGHYEFGQNHKDFFIMIMNTNPRQSTIGSKNGSSFITKF